MYEIPNKQIDKQKCVIFLFEKLQILPKSTILSSAKKKINKTNNNKHTKKKSFFYTYKNTYPSETYTLSFTISVTVQKQLRIRIRNRECEQSNDARLGERKSR